jgi:hypothetical protein
MQATISQNHAERRAAGLAAMEAAQGHVRRRFGLPERDPRALRVVAERYDPPPWAIGCASIHDAMFLFDVVRGLRPRKAIEVGVSSGASSAMVLLGLADGRVPLVDSAGEEVLQSFEAQPICSFDWAREAGCLTREIVPELVAGWKLHVPGSAREAGEMFEGRGVELAVIGMDGDAEGDLGSLLPALAPGAWVVLQDIGQPTEARRLFEGWRGEKIRGQGSRRQVGGTNIGAIRIPEDA